MPALLDSCPTQRLLITEEISEPTRALESTRDDLLAAGFALAAVHDSTIAAVSTIHTPQEEFQTACRWVPALRLLRKPRYLRLRELLVELSGRATAIEEPGMTLIHRDFFAAQLLRDSETVWVVDFDTLCLGHPELDVSTFVAHLFLDGLIAGSAVAEVQQHVGDFVEGYAQSGGRMARDRLRFYLPCALARLGAIQLARGVSVSVVDELWELAGGYLAGSWRLG